MENKNIKYGKDTNYMRWEELGMDEENVVKVNYCDKRPKCHWNTVTWRDRDVLS